MSYAAKLQSQDLSSSTEGEEAEVAIACITETELEDTEKGSIAQVNLYLDVLVTLHLKSEENAATSTRHGEVT